MRCLIRRITRKSRSGVAHSDTRVEVDALAVGRATDQDVFLPDLHVALRHAVIRPAGGNRFAIQARTPSGVQINGRTTQTGVVRSGDRITVGRTELRLATPPNDADLALEVDEAPSRAGQHHGIGAVSLRETGLHKRLWAWTLFVLVLAVGLAIPFAHIHYSSDDAVPVREAGAGFQARANQVLQRVDWQAFGGDRIWDSGPVSRAHRFFGEDCGNCHEQPFQRVTDSACLDCHEGQPHHADAPELMQTSGLDGQRCANCHLEHSGSAGIQATDSNLCIDCHADPGTTMPTSDTRAVSGFGGEAHPEFQARLIRITEGGDFSWRRTRLDQPLSEDNGLVFPHAAHLADEGIEGPDGKEQLECASCHQPGPEGVAMQPTRFERDCQRCHRLDFEPQEPDRQLPHGKPEEIVAQLEEFYARVALAGGYRNPEAAAPEIVRRRRPTDSALDDRERRVALDWAAERAREVAVEVFEYRTCKTCHTVERTPEAPGGWRVQPVRLTQDWFHAARFSHEPHRTSACTDCHAAGDSEDSSDVLMPTLSTCQECHSDTGGQGQVVSRCTDCHGFHAAKRLTMENNNGGAPDDPQ